MREIIEGAEARAAAIEHDADQNARDRTKRLLDNVEAVQSALSSLVEELRSELEEEPRTPSCVEPPLDARLATRAERAEQQQLAALINPEPVEPEDPAGPSATSPEFDEMIQAEIQGMFREGKTRADALHFLERFRLGDNYIGLLDEIYLQEQGGTSGRRGLRGRLRRRSR